MSTPNNLLLTISDQTWLVKSFSDQTPKWIKESNQLYQSENVGSTANKSGTLLIAPELNDLQKEIILLKFFPGSTYQSGLVFNYRNEDNFCLILINNYSENYSGYKIVIQEVINGKASNIHEEKYENEIAGDISVIVLKEENNLNIHLNDREVYSWQNSTIVPSSGVGFYTQNNQNTIFKELYIGDADNMEEVVEDESQEPFEEGDSIDSNAPFDQAEVLEEIDIKTPFDPFLQLQPPNAQSQVEFQEVFNVPLDSFYVSLFEANTKPVIDKGTDTSSEYRLQEQLEKAEKGELFKTITIPRHLYFNRENSLLHIFSENRISEGSSTSRYYVENLSLRRIDLSSGEIIHTETLAFHENKISFVFNSNREDEPLYHEFFRKNLLIDISKKEETEIINLPYYINTNQTCTSISRNEKYIASYNFEKEEVIITELESKDARSVVVGKLVLKEILFVCNDNYLLLMCYGRSKNILSVKVDTLEFNYLDTSNVILKKPRTVSDQIIQVENDDKVDTFDLLNASLIRTYTGHYHLSHFSAFGEYYVDVYDRKLIVFHTNKEVLYELALDESIKGCLFIKKDELLILSDTNTYTWSFTSNKNADSINLNLKPSSSLRGFDYSHDRSMIVLTINQDAYIYAVPSLQLQQKIENVGNYRYYFSVNDDYIYSKLKNHTNIYKVENGDNIDIFYKKQTVNRFHSCSEDCRYLVLEDYIDGKPAFNVYDLQNQKIIYTYQSSLEGYLNTTSISAKGNFIVSNQYQSRVQLAVQGEGLREILRTTRSDFFTPTFSKNNNFIGLDSINYGTKPFYFYNRQLHNIHESFENKATIVTKNGTIYTAFSDGSVGISHQDSPANYKRITTNHEDIFQMVLSPDEKKLFVRQFYNFITIITLDTLAIEEVNLPDTTPLIYWMQPNNDGSKLLVRAGGKDGYLLYVKDLKEQKEEVFDIDVSYPFFAKNDEMIVGLRLAKYPVNSSEIVYVKLTDKVTTVNKVATEPLPEAVKFSYQIDFRPKKWYRRFKMADDEEAFQKDLADNFKDLINQLNAVKTIDANSNAVTYHSHSQVEDQLYEMGAYREKYHEAINALFQARDAKQEVVHEVRTNGYLLLDRETRETEETDDSGNPVYDFGYTKNGKFEKMDAGIDSSITSKGYEFAILKGVPEFKEYQALALNLSAYDLKDHDDWNILINDFKQRLFGSGALTDQQKRLFETKLEELANFDSSDVLKKKKREIEAQIADVESRIQQVEESKLNIQQDKLKWERDRQKLNNLLNAFNFGRTQITEVTDLYNKLRSTNFEKFQFRFENYSRKTTGRRRVTRRFLFFKRTYTYTIVINYHTYNIFHQFKQYASHRFGIRYKHTPSLNIFGFIAYLHTFSNSALDYLHNLMSICDSFFHKVDQSMLEADADIQKIKNEKLFHQSALESLEENGLMELRHLFIQYWNDPDQFENRNIIDNVIRPDSDPLADLISDFIVDDNNKVEEKIDIDVFDFQGDRFYNQDGLTLNAYLRYTFNTDKQRIALFPAYTENGQLNEDLLTAVVNPTKNESVEFTLPVIRFVETHKILITWDGYSLGELTHTENLFPNERKEITLERTTRLTQKREESKASSVVSKAKQTASFEEKLTDEFSQKDNQEKAREDSYEIKDKKSAERSSTTTDTKSSTFSIDAEVSGGFGPVKGSVNTNYSKNKNRTKTDTKKDAHELSKTNQGKTSSKESRESFKKQVANTIKKVAQETTQENKVEVKVNTSEEFSSLDSRREVVTLENPNVGRTINYNFFQLQNNYEVKTILTDVKVVVDYNKEVIKGSGINEVRVYELEEVGKILAGEDSEDPRQVLTAAIVARQAFKNYLEGIPAIGRGNGALKIQEPFEADLNAFQTIFFSNELSSDDLGPQLITKLSSALEYLKKVPFTFDAVEVNPSETYTVNTGGYFLDAEVGKMTALEGYIEKMREREVLGLIENDGEKVSH